MEFLSDDPTYLAGGLGLLGAVLLIATWLTQQGKFLVWAGVAFALALVVLGVERVWVTDDERIEETVYALGEAVKTSDVPGVLVRLTPDVQYVAGGRSMPSAATRSDATRHPPRAGRASRASPSGDPAAAGSRTAAPPGRPKIRRIERVRVGGGQAFRNGAGQRAAIAAFGAG